MKAIIVPLDGSDLAEQALPLAVAVASKQDADIVLVTAIEDGDRWVDDGFVRQWESEEQAAVESYLRRIVDRLREQGARAKAHFEWGRPATVIKDAVQEENAHFVVMTTHGRSGVSRWVLGSVTDKVLRTADTPLILVHPTPESPVSAEVKKVGVALDGSELAENALAEAERFAHSMGASMLLIRSVVPPAALYGAELVPGSLPVLEQLQTEARDYLEGLAERLMKRGVDAGVAVAVGPSAEVILETAREHEVDLIVMTTHGRSGLERWAFGSVADAVVRRGDLPVMVIRPPEVAAEGALEGVPVAGNVVVPPPFMTERASPAAVEPDSPASRPHRPEREPGR